jgi:hypothetical protein
MSGGPSNPFGSSGSSGNGGPGAAGPGSGAGGYPDAAAVSAPASLPEPSEDDYEPMNNGTKEGCENLAKFKEARCIYGYNMSVLDGIIHKYLDEKQAGKSLYEDTENTVSGVYNNPSLNYINNNRDIILDHFGNFSAILFYCFSEGQKEVDTCFSGLSATAASATASAPAAGGARSKRTKQTRRSSRQ